MPRTRAAEKGPGAPPAAGPLDSRPSGCPRARGPHLADVLRSAVAGRALRVGETRLKEDRMAIR